MPFNHPNFCAAGIPHVFSRLNETRKSELRNKYRRLKKYSHGSGMFSVSLFEARKLGQDVLNSKLKAYGYKTLFGVTVSSVENCTFMILHNESSLLKDITMEMTGD